MKTSLKTVLAVVAGAAAISATAAPYDGYYSNRYDRPYAYTYDRYGNAYDQYGNRVDPRVIERQHRAERWRDTPRYEQPRNWEYRYETPKQFDHRLELEAAQRGELDSSVTTHPLSPNYSGG